MPGIRSSLSDPSRVLRTARKSYRGAGRAAHRHSRSIEDVGVDHGRGDIPVPQQFLDASDVVATLKQVGWQRSAGACGE